jgi:hypothetical protein
VNLEAIKHYLVGAVVPVIAAAAATWLASKGVLNVFDISKASATTDLDELGVFVVVAGSGWLTSHHLLSGHYAPAAKAVAGLPVTEHLASVAATSRGAAMTSEQRKQASA